MTRQVILTLKEYVGAGKWEERHPQQATFHTFSQDSEEVKGGSLHYPVAIVELRDGTVQAVCLDRIRFINPI